jgi:membrane protease YdiL (CAAX protease family)/septum formation topological specificity factor MinE
MKNKKILLANTLLLVALLMFVLIPIVANTLFKLKGDISGDTSLLLSGSASVIALGGIALLYCKITKRKFKNVMVIKKMSLKQVMLTLFTAVGTYIFAIGVNAISMQLFPIIIQDGMKISNLLNGSSTFLGLIVVILIPAFFEEVFFRGVLLDAYEGVNKNVKYFILTTIFATFHGNLMQIIYVMFLGLILLKVREYTGTILGSMTLHAANNAISFFISKAAASYMKLTNTGVDNGVIDPNQAVASADAMNASFPGALLGSSIFFLIGGAILFINLRKLKEYKEERDGLELVQEDYMEVVEEYVEIKEESVGIDKKQFIPLAIYFVVITVLVVSSY